MGNQFLANIREADAICQVVRVFADDDVVHVDGRVDPFADIEVIETELILADLQTLEKAIPRLEKDARKNKDLAATLAAAQKAQELLNDGKTLFSQKDSFELSSVRELHLMTAKPFLYVFNADEAVLTDDARKQELRAKVAPADAVFLDAKVESELLELDEDDAQELLDSIGQDEPGLRSLARGFPHAGAADVSDGRAQGVARLDDSSGRHRPKAAGVIHTDFEKGFIKAEVVSFEHLDEHGFDECRQGCRQGPYGGQGLRHARRRRRRVPVQRLGIRRSRGTLCDRGQPRSAAASLNWSLSPSASTVAKVPHGSRVTSEVVLLARNCSTVASTSSAAKVRKRLRRALARTPRPRTRQSMSALLSASLPASVHPHPCRRP